MKIFRILLFFILIPLITACHINLVDKPGSLELQRSRVLIDHGEFKKARILLQKSIESPSVVIRGKASYELARIENVNKNPEKYITLLEQADELGNTHARLNLAQAYIKYQPTQKNLNKAYSIFEEEKNNSASANIALAKMSPSSIKQTEYINKAIELYKIQILNKGHDNGRAYLKMARLYSKYPELPLNTKESELWYRKSIKHGNPDAAYELAKFWVKHNLRKNPEKDAFQLMQQAAESGNTLAIKHIAYAHLRGNGAEKNIAKAIKWYKQIPNNGRKKSFETIADAYMKGDGVIKNETTAFTWYRKSADKGSVKSILMMASQSSNSASQWRNALKKIPAEEMYLTLKKLSRLYSKDYPQIIHRQHHLAANYGSADAALAIANNFENGLGVVQSSRKSQEWYKKAANMGSPEAMIILARIYSLDTNTDNNLEKSFEWYKKAAEKGTNEAQYQTGLLYARGQGTEKNIEKARYWLKKAHKNGYPFAIETLKSILKESK